MAITRPTGGVGTTNTVAAGSGTTMTVAYPSVSGGILAGDVIALFAITQNATSPSTPTGDGFVNAGSGNSGGSTPSWRAAYKVAAGGETGNVTVTFPGSNIHKAVMVCYRGVDNTTPIDVAAGTGGTSSTGSGNIDIAGVTTTVVGVRLVAMGAINGAAATFTPPTTPNAPANFSELVDGNTNVGMTVDDLDWASSGATGTVRITNTSTARNCGVMLALRPAGAAVSGDVSLAVTATFGAAAVTDRPLVAVVGTTATVSVGADRTAISGAAVAVSASVTAAASRTQPLDASLVVTASVVTAGVAGPVIGGSLAVTVTVAAAAALSAVLGASLTGSVTVTAGAVRTAFPVAAVAVTATVTAGLGLTVGVQASLVVTATLVASMFPLAQATLAVTTTIAATGLRVAPVGGSVVVMATVTATALRSAFAVAELAVTVALVAGGSADLVAVAGLVVVATLVAALTLTPAASPGSVVEVSVGLVSLRQVDLMPGGDSSWVGEDVWVPGAAWVGAGSGVGSVCEVAVSGSTVEEVAL